jgi:hypothetical protein
MRHRLQKSTPNFSTLFQVAVAAAHIRYASLAFIVAAAAVAVAAH